LITLHLAGRPVSASNGGKDLAGQDKTTDFNEERRSMQTVRVSSTEVQFNAMVYTFSDNLAADQFEALAAVNSPEFYQREQIAVRRRPIDCDHEVDDFL
jgi:hypothetical protein